MGVQANLVAVPSLPSPSQGSALSFPPLLRMGSEKEQRERRTAVQGRHQTPPPSISSHTQNQCPSSSTLVLNGCFVMIRMEVK